MLQQQKLIDPYVRFSSLQKQHINSFNYFLNHSIHQILTSTHNKYIKTDADPSFLLSYMAIRIENPTHEINYSKSQKKSLLLPSECRTSDLTYSGDIMYK